jgi:hypothetical protein
MTKRVAGVCYVKVDGDQLEVKGGVEAPISEVTREPVLGLGGVAGFKEAVQEPFLKLSAIVPKTFPINTLVNGTNMAVTAELANGKVYTLSGAYLKGEPAINGEEGSIELEFSGTKGIWQ